MHMMLDVTVGDIHILSNVHLWPYPVSFDDFKTFLFGGFLFSSCIVETGPVQQVSHRKLAHFISKMQHCILSIPTLDL